MNVGFVSLGCSKNLIDTEMAIGLFKDNKYSIVNNVKEAEIIVINTCGFIESAKEEAINTILEMAEYKTNGKCKYLVVMGCLVQRYKKELIKSIPEVDLFISIDEYNLFWEKINSLINEKVNYKKTKKICNDNSIKTNKGNEKEGKLNEFDYLNRVVTTGNKTAYLKIAEGCSNKCTYCAIPYIRGEYVSRPIEEILEEAKKLAKKGYKEIIVIAQDTTRYGEDIYGKKMLSNLLDDLCKIDGFEWIRFLYAYPETITDDLIDVVKNNDKICNYFDIPIQHISDKVLKRMNRKVTGKQIEDIIEKIKTKIPDVILRTSLIVGFPGETNEDFEMLCNFVEKGYFNKLGVFMYSKEDGTPAARLPEQIHHNTKKKRYNEIMKIAMGKSKENIKKYIGKEFKVLIEGKTSDESLYFGRSYMDIPETDGIVFVKSNKKDLIGKFINVRIIDSNEYDLIAKSIN